mgnify:CR=1 FL=1
MTTPPVYSQPVICFKSACAEAAALGIALDGEEGDAVVGVGGEGFRGRFGGSGEQEVGREEQVISR